MLVGLPLAGKENWGGRSHRTVTTEAWQGEVTPPGPHSKLVVQPEPQPEARSPDPQPHALSTPHSLTGRPVIPVLGFLLQKADWLRLRPHMVGCSGQLPSQICPPKVKLGSNGKW